MFNEPLISIVTISYQAEAAIGKTINSVLIQTYRNIEYIFKDGDSKDNTNEIINQYEKLLHNRGIRTKHIVNKDSGIYDAMNQSLKYCEGKYILFLNADDELYSADVLQDIFSSEFDYGNADIIYGDADFIDAPLHFLWKGDLSVTKDKCPFCHQSSFVEKQWMITHPFDETLQITADYDFIYKSLIEGADFCYVDIIISKFYRGGISGTHLVKDRKEHRRVQLRYNEKEEHRIDRTIKYILILAESYIQELIFKIISPKLCTWLRHWNKKRKMNLIRD